MPELRNFDLNLPVAFYLLMQEQNVSRALASGEMTPGQFTAFLLTAFRLFSKHSSAGSLHYCCMDWRHMSEVLAAGDLAYSEMMNLRLG
jgi:hypothetical protein